MNYIRCDDLPTVFTQILDQNKLYRTLASMGSVNQLVRRQCL